MPEPVVMVEETFDAFCRISGSLRIILRAKSIDGILTVFYFENKN